MMLTRHHSLPAEHLLNVVSHAQNGMLWKDKCVVPHVQYSMSNSIKTHHGWRASGGRQEEQGVLPEPVPAQQAFPGPQDPVL